jgi:Low-density lipoprotein receptor domain class A
MLFLAENPCNQYDFWCTDGDCVPATWRCDLDIDCTDGSDELDCGEKLLIHYFYNWFINFLKG